MATKLAKYFKNDVILGSGYPLELAFLHSLNAVTNWRKSREGDDTLSKSPKPSWLNDFVCAFFCHGFGGTILRDWFMAQTPALFTNPNTPKLYALAYAIIYYSPSDVVYRMICSPNTPASLLVCAYEAVDSSTTVCGSVEKAKTLFPESPVAPFIAAMLAGVGGSVFRYIERRFGRGWDISTEWNKPTQTMRVTLLYTVAYMQLREIFGVRNARFYVASFHVVWSLLKQLSGKSLDFTENTIGKLF